MAESEESRALTSGQGESLGADKSLDVDSICVRLGWRGRYQLRQWAMHGFGSILNTIVVFVVVFVGYEPDYQCSRPENVTQLQDYLPDDVTNFTLHDVSYQQCSIDVTVNRSGVSSTHSLPCVAGINFSMPADTSFTTEWSLVCDKTGLTELTQTGFFAGQALGSLVMGILADRCGRRRVYLVSALATAATFVAMSVVPSYELILLCRTASGFFEAGVETSAYTLFLELFPQRKRWMASIWDATLWAAANVGMAGVAYCLRGVSWRHLTLALGAIVPGCFLLPCFLDESLRWLIAVGKMEEAERIVRKACRLNGKDFHALLPLLRTNHPTTTTPTNNNNDNNTTHETTTTTAATSPLLNNGREVDCVELNPYREEREMKKNGEKEKEMSIVFDSDNTGDFRCESREEKKIEEEKDEISGVFDHHREDLRCESREEKEIGEREKISGGVVDNHNAEDLRCKNKEEKKIEEEKEKISGGVTDNHPEDLRCENREEKMIEEEKEKISLVDNHTEDLKSRQEKKNASAKRQEESLTISVLFDNNHHSDGSRSENREEKQKEILCREKDNISVVSDNPMDSLIGADEDDDDEEEEAEEEAEEEEDGEECKLRVQFEPETSSPVQYNVWDLFRYRVVFVPFLVCCFVWMTNNTFMYVTLLGSATLSGDRFLNYAGLCALQLPSTLTALLLMPRFNRRQLSFLFGMLEGGFLLLSVCLLELGGGEEATVAMATAAQYAGVFCLNSSYMLLFVYYMEVLPTSLRAVGTGIEGSVIQLTNMAAPFLLVWARITAWAPGVLVGCLLCLASLSIWLLPETRHRKLPDTIEEIQRWKKNKKTSSSLA